MWKPSSVSNLTIGRCPSDDKWKSLGGKTSSLIKNEPKPHHPLLNEEYSAVENMRKT